MIMCQCHGVNDRKVCRAIDRGARCVESIGEACGAGTACGGCHEWLEAMLAERVRVRLGAA